MSKQVLEFLRHENRPFSLSEISSHLDKSVASKSAIQKALDRLVDSDEVIQKVYNKQKIYCIKQNENTDPQQLQEDLKSLDRDINAVELKLKSNQDKLVSTEASYKESQSRMTIEQMSDNITVLQAKIIGLETKLEELESSHVEVVGQVDIKQVLDRHESYAKEYRKRKRICNDILYAILEGYPKSKKHLYEEIGIETDEDVGFKLEP